MGRQLMNNVERIPLYILDIFKCRLKNHEKIKDYLMKNVYPNFVKYGPNDEKQNTYSDYLSNAVKVPWGVISKFYDEDIHNILQEIGIDFSKPWKYKVTYWYVFTTDNRAEFVHDHTGGPDTIQLSAVHYVVLDKESQGTFYLHPCEKKMKSVIPTKSLQNLPDYFFPKRLCPDVEEGDLVVFPSWLDHHAPKHTNGSLRLVVAMNIMLRLDDGMAGY